MSKLAMAVLSLWFCLSTLCAGEVLIVADEFPAMEVLAQALQSQAGIDSRIVKQGEMPASLAAFSAVIVYIHKDLDAAAEKAFIAYAKGGGKLVVLHHSISSGKRANKEWFAFLGVSLPPGDVSQGGYQWTEGISFEVVNRAPAHFITTNQVPYEALTSYPLAESTGGEQLAPAFTLHDSEVYLNHVLTRPRTVLLGLKYEDRKSGKTYTQDTAGWYRPAGKGWVFYFMPGHSVRDFQQPAFQRIVLNAVIFKP
jgi:hypothetical protein